MQDDITERRAKHSRKNTISDQQYLDALRQADYATSRAASILGVTPRAVMQRVALLRQLGHSIPSDARGNLPYEPQFEYTWGRPTRWQPGFVVLTFDEDGVLLPPETCEWTNNRAIFRGRAIETEQRYRVRAGSKTA